MAAVAAGEAPGDLTTICLWRLETGASGCHREIPHRKPLLEPSRENKGEKCGKVVPYEKYFRGYFESCSESCFVASSSFWNNRSHILAQPEIIGRFEID